MIGTAPSQGWGQQLCHGTAMVRFAGCNTSVWQASSTCHCMPAKVASLNLPHATHLSGGVGHVKAEEAAGQHRHALSIGLHAVPAQPPGGINVWQAEQVGGAAALKPPCCSPATRPSPSWAPQSPVNRACALALHTASQKYLSPQQVSQCHAHA